MNQLYIHIYTPSWISFPLRSPQSTEESSLGYRVGSHRWWWCSVAKSCLTLLRRMDCGTPGFPVLHCLPEFTQTHVGRVGDAIRPSHPLLSPSPPAPSPSQHRGLSGESALGTRWPENWSLTVDELSVFHAVSATV